MARKKKHEEHENHERWLVSYADFITLLFAFFVVMYSVSAVNEGRFRVLSDSLMAAFRSSPKSLDPVQLGNPMKAPLLPQQDQIRTPGRPNAPNTTMLPPVQMTMATRPQPPSAAEVAQARLEAERAKVIQQLAAELEQALAPLIDQQLVNVRSAKSWMEVEIKTSILFPSGSAALSRTAITTLEKVAKILTPYPNPIHVEGFTDNHPIRTVAFPSNWELSAARAASVVHLFSRTGVDAERMAAIGYGEHRPIADNRTQDGRNANRRVVLVVLADPKVRRLQNLESGTESKPGTESKQGSAGNAPEAATPAASASPPPPDVSAARPRDVAL